MISCNVISPQIFWFKRARTSIPILFALSIVINIGMWFERFVIIVTSLHRDYLPSAWAYFSPTVWDVSCLLGSFGLFFTMFCLFVRFLPMVATAEVKTVLPQADPHWQPGPEREIRHHGAGLRTGGSPAPAPEGAS
jgi:molybdopterin-containing oxidoreductase family membrane subunit